MLLAIGVLAYSLLFERWSILDSLYFTTVLLTTVGYGDFTPSTPGGKLFAAIFALGGIVILGLALGVLGSQLVEAEIRYTETMKSKTTRALESAFILNAHRRQRREKSRRFSSHLDSQHPSLSSYQHDSVHSLSSLNSLDSASSKESTYSIHSAKNDFRSQPSTREHSSERHLTEGDNSLWWTIRHDYLPSLSVIQRHLPGFAPMLVGSFIMARLEKWSWYDAIYYCVVTATVSRNLSI